MNMIFENLITRIKKIPATLVFITATILFSVIENLPWFIVYFKAIIINDDTISVPWNFMIFVGMELVCIVIAIISLIFSYADKFNYYLSMTITTKIILFGVIAEFVLADCLINNIQTMVAINNLRNYLLLPAIYLTYIQRDYWNKVVVTYLSIIKFAIKITSHHIKNILIILAITLGLILIGYGCLYKYSSYGNYNHHYWEGLSIFREFYTDSAEERCAKTYLEITTKATIGKSGFMHKLNADMTGCVNIDEEGMRQTWKIPKANQKKEFVIWIFGGSTIYSGYTADNKTIPSYLAKYLYSAGIKNIKVVNFGITTYNITQEKLRFEQALIWYKQYLPNLVLFYDGVNEIVSGVENLDIKHVDNYASLNFFYNRSMANIIEQKQNLNAAFYHVIKLAFQEPWKTAIARFKFENNLSQKIYENQTLPPEISQIIAEQALEVYLMNMGYVENTTRRLNIPVVFFLQPNIFTKKIWGKLEKKNVKPFMHLSTAYDNYYRLAKKIISSGKYSNWIDISDTFKNDGRDLYFDWCHCRASANELIAERIGEYLLVEGLIKRE